MSEKWDRFQRLAPLVLKALPMRYTELFRTVIEEFEFTSEFFRLLRWLKKNGYVEKVSRIAPYVITDKGRRLLEAYENDKSASKS